MNMVEVVLISALVALGVVLLLISRGMRIRFRAREDATRHGALSLDGLVSRVKEVTDQAGIDLLPREVVLIGALTGVIPFFACQALGLALNESLIAALFGVMIVPLWIMMKRRRNIARFEDHLGNAMPLIAANLRAGLTLRQALIPVAENMGEPLKSEFFRLVEEVSSGASMSKALDDLAKRVKSDDLRLFATAVSIQSVQGGSIADITEQVGATVRTRSEMRQFVKSKTSMAKTSTTIMTIIPVVIFFALMGISQVHRDFYLSADGLPVILLCLFMDGAGLLVLSKMGKIV